jgi:hypothetical protein
MTERIGVDRGDSRPRTISVVILLMTLVVGMGAGAALVHAYDPRIDEAMMALQKAAALVEAASAGNVSARTQARFDRHVDKALSNIEEAMGHIVAAGVAADSDGSR